ncbi:MAG: hypothetical protein GY731_12125, partial [Gammaproteobacteria bacterium]|nr:hypothetical protein [Gammaproteobacteria bacterium]
MSGVAREFIGENWPTIGVIAAICAGQGIWLGGLAVVLPALLAGIWLYTLFRQAQQARLSEEENHEIPVLTIERDVNALVEDSSQMIAGELTTVRQELDQVRVLVNEAITTLNSSFTGLNDESQREAQLVMSIMEDMSGGEAETGESDQPGFSGQGEADRGAGVTGEEADGAGQITIKRFSEETSVV